MSGFSFTETAGTSQSNIKPRLEGNKIHAVKLVSCELKDFDGVKDPSQTYKTIAITFGNGDGVYEHSIFEPKAEDFERKTNSVNTKKGTMDITNPSNVETMMLLFKHIIDSYNPKIAKDIDEKKKVIAAKDWDGLRLLIQKIIEGSKGKIETNIKLLKNKKGEATFPGFFANLSKEGVAYVKNNFIGEKIAFSPYELQRIENEANAKPSDMNEVDNQDFTEESADDLDLEFEVEAEESL